MQQKYLSLSKEKRSGFGYTTWLKLQVVKSLLIMDLLYSGYDLDDVFLMSDSS